MKSKCCSHTTSVFRRYCHRSERPFRFQKGSYRQGGTEIYYRFFLQTHNAELAVENERKLGKEQENGNIILPL